MGVVVSPRGAWTSTVAVGLAGCVWLAAGVTAAVAPGDMLVRIGGATIAAGGVMTLAGAVLRLRRGGWNTAAAARVGAGWPQPMLMAGMFSGIASTFLTSGVLNLLGALVTIACALGLLIYLGRR